MPIHYEREDHIVTITIDRPEARNSLDMEHFSALADAWRRFRDEDEAWVAIVTGVGDTFCVGADLKTFIPQVTGVLPKPERWKPEDGQVAVLRNIKIYKPIIAAVNGLCVAGGMEMLGGTDIRVASENATFAVMEPKRGLFAGGGTTVRLPRQIPFPYAMEFLLTADRIPARRALQMGLLNEVVPREKLMDAAMDYARRIAANAPLAIRATKQSVLEGLAMDLESAYENESRLAAMVFATEDAKEGPRAFAEKRPPVWKGK
ncbi:MAG: putative enoyl-CoA hydratase [Candidatus Binatia bacterium]|nr:MAG: putative enoyl-CoA hydratase [Candidatus Binatia bacterium]